MNMQNLMKQAQQMQNDMLKLQKELESTIYDGSSSMVSVKVNGKKDLKELVIKDKESFSLDDLDMLEDMILVSLNDAFKKVDVDKEQKMGKFKGFSGLL